MLYVLPPLGPQYPSQVGGALGTNPLQTGHQSAESSLTCLGHTAVSQRSQDSTWGSETPESCVGQAILERWGNKLPRPSFSF